MFRRVTAHLIGISLLFSVVCAVQGTFADDEDVNIDSQSLSAANTSKNLDTYLAQGKSALEKGDYKVGVQFLAKAVEESTLDEEKINYRSKTLEVMQTVTTNMFDKEDLLSDYSSVQAIHTGILTIIESAFKYDFYQDSAMLFNQKGSVYRRKSEIDKAMAEYNNALKIDSQYSPSIFNLALCYFKQREYKKAYEELGKIPESEPNYGNTSKEKRDFLLKNFGQYILK